MRYERDAVSPWAFFLPIALAVLVGSLVADAVGHWMRGRFAEAPVPAVARVAVPADIAPDPMPPPLDPLPQPVLPAPPAPTRPVEPPHPDAAALAGPQEVPGEAAPVDTSRVDTRRLSGPMTARQSGESESCINNTVATRSPNGWEQALENDAPVRCEASSP